MNSLIYFFRFLYRIRYWLIFAPLLVAAIMYLHTRRMIHTYQTHTTIYTGVVSGYDVESTEGTKQDWNIINNAMDNLINIITAQTTLHNVSMRLYAQHLVHGDPNKDNTYLSARTYRILLSRTPKNVLALVDRNSEENTLANLYAYEKASPNNHVYGLFNYTHRHYSYEALSKIKVKRVGSSDMLDVNYEADDPGVAYNTLMLLNDEFVKQYQDLRFGETNNVISYFEKELARTRAILTGAEDSLRDYNVDMKVINYDEQTKHIAALSRDFELRYETILLENNSTKKLMETMDERIAEHVKQLRNNTLFIEKLNKISDLSARIATLESFQSDSISTVPSYAEMQQKRQPTDVLKAELKRAESELTGLTLNLGEQYYTKEGLSTTALVPQWLDVLIRFEKSSSELKVMTQRKIELEKQYQFYSPIGTTIKRKEREIDFTEQSYLSILHSLNAARLKQKSLQMSSATLKIINPPTFPVAAMPTKNKLKVMAAFFGTLIFVLGYFILLELLDHTLRDKQRTERITRSKVLGAFPAPERLRGRRFATATQQISAQYMGNALLNYLKADVRPNIINLLSTDTGTGKSFLAEQLQAYLEGTGLKVRYVSWHSDFNIEHKNYLLAQQLSDFVPIWDTDAENGSKNGSVDIIIVEHPSLSAATVPKALLHDSSLNIVVACANRVWKETDQMLLDKTVKYADGTPVVLYLNMARREVVESFTGMLPPYTPWRTRMFKFYQFGLTSSGH